MEYSKVCKQCGKEFIAKRKHAECCSAICRARFSEGLAPKPESESESAQRPKQASFEGGTIFMGSDSHEYITIPVSLYNWLMANIGNVDIQKKIEAVLPMPVATVAIETEEMIAKRNADTIRNTLNSIADF